MGFRQIRGNIGKRVSLSVVLRTRSQEQRYSLPENFFLFTVERKLREGVRALKMIEERRGAPYGVLLAVVVGIVVVVPMLVGEQGEAITGAISELLSPVGLLLLPIVLLLLIQFLSSDRASVLSGIFSTGEPDSIHRLSGSPLGVALFLLLLIFLLNNRISLFGSEDDSGD